MFEFLYLLNFIRSLHCLVRLIEQRDPVVHVGFFKEFNPVLGNSIIVPWHSLLFGFRFELRDKRSFASRQRSKVVANRALGQLWVSVCEFTSAE